MMPQATVHKLNPTEGLSRKGKSHKGKSQITSRLSRRITTQVRNQVQNIKEVGKDIVNTVEDIAEIPATATPHRRELAPFISVVLLVITLLSVVFCKMEIRRMGYSILKLTHEERQMKDQERMQLIQLAKMTRPERLQQVAEHKLTLKKAESGQIIQMTEQGVAFRETHGEKESRVVTR